LIQPSKPGCYPGLQKHHSVKALCPDASGRFNMTGLFKGQFLPLNSGLTNVPYLSYDFELTTFSLINFVSQKKTATFVPP
jgi:hypothetical protein